MMNLIVDILKFNAVKCTPCTMAEIQELEEKQGTQFPGGYVEFLETMGKDAGQFMVGSFAYYKDLELINAEAKELLKANNFKDLPENTFVFWMHQGYQFAFFSLNKEDDPPVFYYNETISQVDFTQTYERLSDFYYDEIINSGIEIPKSLKRP